MKLFHPRTLEKVLFLSAIISLAGCASLPKEAVQPETLVEDIPIPPPPEPEIKLTIAGDIMAHKPNFAISDYSEVYKGITHILQESDFSMVNLEAPVTDSIDYSSYPYFNVHTEYAQAAIDAGFNIFSLSNNHSNDQGLTGIQSTMKVFDKLRKEQNIYSSGLKEADKSFSYEIIEYNDMTIMFMAVTNLLNQNTYTKYINYVRPTKTARKEFVDYIADLRHNVECDVFILALHSASEEYVLDITNEEKEFFHQLTDNGVDILWANHPHISKGWDIITDQDNIARKVIFYSMGNTISGQRWEPDFANPENSRDYTGDAYMANLTLAKDSTGIRIKELTPVLITTYITPQWHFVIKVLDDDFIRELDESGKKTWAKYLTQRKKLMEQIKGIQTWQ